MSETPGGELGGRPLHFIFICDCSGSMYGEKIASLNYAVSSVIPKMRDEANNSHNAQILMRVLAFSSKARWVVSQPTDIHQFNWSDLSISGVTDMGYALKELADQLDTKNMPLRGLPPVLVLLSDGQPTDDFDSGLKALMSKQWGKRAIRIAIAIGQDADIDVLQKFIGDQERQPLQANNAEQLLAYIQWATTVVVQSVVRPPSQMPGTSTNHIAPPPVIGGNDVW